MNVISNKLGFGFIALTVAGAIAPVASAATTYNDAVLADNPSYYWTFDEVDGPAIDQVAAGGAADDVAPVNGAARTAGTSTAGGVPLGNAALFTGGNSEFTAADLSGVGAIGVYAIEFWTRLDSASASYLLAFGVNAPAVINGYNPGQLELFSGTRTADVGAGPFIADGAWHHVVIGNNGSSHTIIVDDGTPLVYGNSPAAVSQGAIYVGSSDLADSITGALDELAVYDLSNAGDFNAALSEIAAHYNVVVPEPGSLAVLSLAGLAALRRRRGASA